MCCGVSNTFCDHGHRYQVLLRAVKSGDLRRSECVGLVVKTVGRSGRLCVGLAGRNRWIRTSV
jgi:hypothetical protein